MRIIFSTLSIFLCIVTSAQTFMPDASIPLDPAVKTGKLQNGLVYYIRHNEKPENRVELRLAVNTGSTMENDDQQGLAHLIEHMAFNGTANFPKSALVDYLESIGTAFGPHINAYTSFDETVYMLQIPTDRPDYVKKGMQILQDWSHNLSFEPTEIDKERGVVIEEWRTRLGANERMRTVYWPVLFKDSRYGERLPIGQPDIIRNAPYEKLTSFYQDWYRPDNMAVVIVGDIDVNEMEQMVIENFSALTNPANELPVQKWPVPDYKDLQIVHATDKEATTATVQVVYKHNPWPQNTVADYRAFLAVQLYNSMMASRLSEIRKKSDPPFSMANSSFGSLVRNKSSFRSFAAVSDTGIMRGLETLIIENERVKRFGFTETELERQKKAMMRAYENAFAEKDKNESANYADELVTLYLENIPAPGIQYELEFVKKFLDGIGVEEVDALAREWITDNQENCTIIMLAPDNEGVIIPTDEQVRNAFKSVAAMDIEPYKDEFIDKPLLSIKPTPGTVVKEEYNEAFDYRMLTLSNGAVVYLKHTDFKNDQILLNALSFGGRSAYSQNEDINARFAASIMSNSGLGDFNQVQFDKFLQGKRASVTPSISEYTEMLSGGASPLDLELWMQMIYLRSTGERKDAEGFNSFLSQQAISLQNRAADPANAFRDTIQLTMANNHPRRMPVSLEMTKKIEHSDAVDIYHDRFSNAGDFVYVFVGNFDEKQLRPLILQYIGSGPAQGVHEKWNDLGIAYPEGSGTKTVHRGIEQKSMVQLSYTGSTVSSNKERLLFQATNNLMQIKLRETLREDESGTYGVGCSGIINRIPNNDFIVNVNFQCDPANTDKLLAAANDVVNSVKNNGCSAEDLTKVTEGLRRARETALQDNNYWVSVLGIAALYGEQPLTNDEFEKALAEINSETLKKSSNKYFNNENKRQFILLPENK